MLTLIIVSYNSYSVIEECLASLIDSKKYPTIIIDNASTDYSAIHLKQRFLGVEVVELDQNIGYGRATNEGLNKVKTPYAILLNPDLHASPEDIESLLNHARMGPEKVAILAPAVKEKDFTGGQPKSVNWISGSAMLFKMKHLEQIGLFDENIFLFSEETDLCLRTINAGYKIMLCHDVFMEHLKGQSSPPNPQVEWMKDWHFGWSRAYYFEKHNMASGKKKPARMARNYGLKGFLATDPNKRRKYKGRCAGVRAFMKGEPAFCANGTPQASPSLQR